MGGTVTDFARPRSDRLDVGYCPPSSLDVQACGEVYSSVRVSGARVTASRTAASNAVAACPNSPAWCRSLQSVWPSTCDHKPFACGPPTPGATPVPRSWSGGCLAFGSKARGLFQTFRTKVSDRRHSVHRRLAVVARSQDSTRRCAMGNACSKQRSLCTGPGRANPTHRSRR